MFLLQWSTFPTSPSASGVAGFTVGVYVLFVILATLSLETRYILLTAATGAVFEVLLQHLAGVSVGAMISTVILLGLTTLACSYARDRLVGLAGRVETAAQLEAASRRAEDRLRETMGLLGIAQTLGGVTEVNEALRRICRELARLTGAETVAAYLVDRERAELRPTAGYRVPKDMLDGLAAMRVGLADVRFAAVLEKGDLLWSDNVPEDSRLRPWSDRFPHRSALAIPSIVGGRVSAVFYLVWWTRRHSFDRAELTLAQAIGEQVGTFIQNAQLYEQLDESRQRSVQAERLRAVGEMAAGVAHDFNNILAIILGRAELLLKTTSVPEVRRPLDIIVKAAQDGARTVRRIKEFTRQSPGARREPVDLRALARDVVEMTRARWHDQAEAKRPPLRRVRRGRRRPARAGRRGRPPGSAHQSRLQCARRDAAGRPPDPPHRRGRGAGPVRRPGHGRGNDSRPPRAGLRALLLDQDREGQRARAQHRLRHRHPARRRDRGGEHAGRRVRVPDLAADRRRGLPGLGGGAVRSAGGPGRPNPRGGRRGRGAPGARRHAGAGRDTFRWSARTAWRRCGRWKPRTFDLVLTDLGMPGLGGWEVARAVKQRHPGMPVGLITGWGDSIDAADAARRGVDFLLAKPFQMRDLHEALARVLGDRAR